jgi:putative membrane protein
MSLHGWMAVAALALGADEKLDTTDGFLSESLAQAACTTRASELALRHAGSKEARQLARKTITEQRGFRKGLIALSVDNYVPIRTNEGRGQDVAERALARLKGAAFDRAYLALIVEQHKRWVELTRRTAESGPRLERALAARLLPGMQERLKEARRLLKATR